MPYPPAQLLGLGVTLRDVRTGSTLAWSHAGGNGASVVHACIHIPARWSR
jgi:hypothetical protein